MDWTLVDAQNKITPLDMYAVALGYNPDELSKALKKEGEEKPID